MSKRPSMFQPVERAKFDAWSSFQSLTKEEAMIQYKKEVDKLQITDTVDSSEHNFTPSSTSSAIALTSSIPSTLKDLVLSRQVGESKAINLNLKTIQTKFHDSDGILEIQLNRPKRGNAFNFQMWTDFHTIFDAIQVDQSCKVVILKGNSSSFSTGMDLEVFAEMQSLLASISCEGRRREAMAKTIQFLQDAISKPENCVVPVIAAVSGHCIGGAIDLITACDLRYCTKASTFSIKETDLAMVADIGTLQRLPGLIGQQRCRELAYTGRVFDGEEAERIGLVLKCFDTEVAMNKHVMATAKMITEKSPLTIRGIKKTITYARDHSIENSLEQVKLWNSAFFFSKDIQEAFGAVMSKSQPKYTEK
ncbi:unnamed protein product [Sphagnum balticum]